MLVPLLNQVVVIIVQLCKLATIVIVVQLVPKIVYVQVAAVAKPVLAKLQLKQTVPAKVIAHAAPQLL